MQIMNEISLSIRLLQHDQDGQNYGVDIVFSSGEKDGVLLAGSIGEANPKSALQQAIKSVFNEHFEEFLCELHPPRQAENVAYQAFLENTTLADYLKMQKGGQIYQNIFNEEYRAAFENQKD